VIAYSDLTPQYEPLRNELLAAIAEVIDRRQFILGSYVEKFEREFAEYCGVKHAIAVNSGTSALHLALLAAGVESGDEVITVPFTFAATVATIHYCGATPRFVDIDPRTFNINVEQIEAAVSPRTKAIVPVHLYGQPADMDPILEIAKKYAIAVIEDAAQAHGAEYRGRRAGSIGNLACFSFYPSKNLGACGEGGAVTTNDPQLAANLRMLRDWGQDRKYHHAIRGFNYRMEGLQGAILSVKLRYLEQWTESRQKAAARYDKLLRDADVVRPAAEPWVRHVYHTYTVRSGSRDALQQHLLQAGIQTAVHYPAPLHLQPAYQQQSYPAGSLPEAERAAREVLSLPMYVGISDEAQATVAKAVLERHS
jgi:dTDP-4-amino-4,6-dideoxygalactose transaminase